MYEFQIAQGTIWINLCLKYTIDSMTFYQMQITAVLTMLYKESLEFKSWHNIDKKYKICKHIVCYFPIKLV